MWPSMADSASSKGKTEASLEMGGRRATVVYIYVYIYICICICICIYIYILTPSVAMFQKERILHPDHKMRELVA